MDFFIATDVAARVSGDTKTSIFYSYSSRLSSFFCALFYFYIVQF